ncbi:hypothetical protein GGF46_000463 [Coemansia sp. RSA 552]|nr:hypothetical protein GGF46_000463 [Coemansia sp. RSA 552]
MSSPSPSSSSSLSGQGKEAAAADAASLASPKSAHNAHHCVLDLPDDNSSGLGQPKARRQMACYRRMGLCMGRVGKRFGSMVAGACLLAVVLIPLHESTIISPYNFRSMGFDWKTNPRDHLVPADPEYSDYNVLVDGHSHTTLSDGRLTPEQLVEYSIAQGFNALIVTDHNTVAGGLRAEKYARDKYPGRFVVIPGMEYSNCRLHMNLININTTIADGDTSFPSDAEIRHVIARTHELGGLAIVNHIPWSTRILERLDKPRLPAHPSIQALVEWGVDGFEVINQATFDMPTFQYMQGLRHNHTRTQADAPPGLLFMTGSDIHTPGKAYAWTVLRTPDLSRDAIMQEISNGRTSYLFDPTGNRAGDLPGYSSRYLALAPLHGLGGYISSFYDRYSGQYSFHGTHCQRDVVDVHGTSIGFLVLYVAIAAILAESFVGLFRRIRHLGVSLWNTHGSRLCSRQQPGPAA